MMGHRHRDRQHHRTSDGEDSDGSKVRHRPDERRNGANNTSGRRDDDAGSGRSDLTCGRRRSLRRHCHQMDRPARKSKDNTPEARTVLGSSSPKLSRYSESSRGRSEASHQEGFEGAFKTSSKVTVRAIREDSLDRDDRSRDQRDREQTSERSQAPVSRSQGWTELLVDGVVAAAAAALVSAASSYVQHGDTRNTSGLRNKAFRVGIGREDGIGRGWRPPREDEELWWVESAGEQRFGVHGGFEGNRQWEKWDERTSETAPHTCRQQPCDKVTEGGVLDTLLVPLQSGENEPVLVHVEHPEEQAMCQYVRGAVRLSL